MWWFHKIALSRESWDPDLSQIWMQFPWFSSFFHGFNFFNKVGVIIHIIIITQGFMRFTLSSSGRSHVSDIGWVISNIVNMIPENMWLSLKWSLRIHVWWCACLIPALRDGKTIVSLRPVNLNYLNPGPTFPQPNNFNKNYPDANCIIIVSSL